jgi:hypothetical protein
MRTSGPRWSKTPETAAALRELEALLRERLRFLGGASYRQRLQIEDELSEIRRDLERLGSAPLGWPCDPLQALPDES